MSTRNVRTHDASAQVPCSCSSDGGARRGLSTSAKWGEQQVAHSLPTPAPQLCVPRQSNVDESERVPRLWLRVAVVVRLDALMSREHRFLVATPEEIGGALSAALIGILTADIVQLLDLIQHFVDR